MFKKLFIQVSVISALSSSAFAVAALNFKNDSPHDIYQLRINDEGYEIKGSGLIVPGEIHIAPGKNQSFEIVHATDEDQALLRQERDQITEILYDIKNGQEWQSYKYKVPNNFDIKKNKDLALKASEFKIAKLSK